MHQNNNYAYVHAIKSSLLFLQILLFFMPCLWDYNAVKSSRKLAQAIMQNKGNILLSYAQWW